jgi:hypothetical protein
VVINSTICLKIRVVVEARVAKGVKEMPQKAAVVENKPKEEPL